MKTLITKEDLIKELKILSTNSKSTRAKVGAILVDNYFGFGGFNQIVGGFSNKSLENLETKLTHGCVSHAEEIAIFKMATNKIADYSIYFPIADRTLFVTHSPCINCCKLIVNFNIKNVIYLEEYGNFDIKENSDTITPKEYLLSNNISINKFSI